MDMCSVFRVLFLASLLTSPLLRAQDPQVPLRLDELRKLRHDAAHRRRGIIANNDGCDCLYYPKDQEVTAAAFLDRRTTALAGTQISTIAYCSISSGFSNFTHDTKVGTVLTLSGAEFGILPKTRNVAQDLIDQGADCLKLVVDYGHRNDMEVFWSMRMNDTHDVAYRPDKPYLLYPPLKVEHPDWLVGEPIKRTPHGRWSSVNYARPEVRELAHAYIEEVCRNYDVDGVELDFFRHMCYFPSTAQGAKATDEERGQMTELMQRVRSTTETVGCARRRPILVAIRVADSVEYNRDLGLDVERWLQEGLVDLLITTCYFRLNPWSYSVELGHKYDVPVYPCLSDSRVKNQDRFHRRSTKSYRARAINAWAAGADGIHLFNSFNPKAPLWKEIGDPQTLAGLDKLYFVTVRDGNPNAFLANGAAYRNTGTMLVPTRPVVVSPDRPLELEIMVGDDLAGARATAAQPAVTCHVDIPRVQSAERLDVSVNGKLLEGGTSMDTWLDWPVPISCLKRGVNQIRIALREGAPVAADAWSLAYDASAMPSKPWKPDPGSVRTNATLGDGVLTIADRGDTSGDYLYYRFPWGADFSDRVVVEAEARVISGASYVIMADSKSGERVGLHPDHIDLFHDRKTRHDMDTTDGFHTYRMVIEKRGLTVYVDGEKRLEAPRAFASRRGYTRNEIAFGATNSGGLGEAEWRSIRARLNTVSCRDLALSVTYPKP